MNEDVSSLEARIERRLGGVRLSEGFSRRVLRRLDEEATFDARAWRAERATKIKHELREERGRLRRRSILAAAPRLLDGLATAAVAAAFMSFEPAREAVLTALRSSPMAAAVWSAAGALAVAAAVSGKLAGLRRLI